MAHILIGLGGTGSRVINKVARHLTDNGIAFNDGNICCAVLDTDGSDNTLLQKTGTGVPVIATSRDQTIEQYIRGYDYTDIAEWCPTSPAFARESMLNGASQVRLKSRIAFMDSVARNVLDEKLGPLVNAVRRQNPAACIRVMVVSSIAGGTGSGMFIQAALWLRRYLEPNQCIIRGIFLLPDVFVHTVNDIRDNNTAKERIYGNAYAALRELNAITKVLKGSPVRLTKKIKLDELFDSDANRGAGKGVYDLAFLIDESGGGITLNSMAEYEEFAAQLTYMQLFAPMSTSMYSTEDNLFIQVTSKSEPMYGSCGTAKAVYPMQSVKEYCCLRAAKDCISLGWRKIDDEIDARIREQQQRERSGDYSQGQIDARELFAKLFEDKISVDADNVGRDRFFSSIAKDASNEHRRQGEDDRIVVSYTDKVEDFLRDCLKKKIRDTVDRNSFSDKVVQIWKSLKDREDEDPEQIANMAKDNDQRAERFLKDFEENVREYADSLTDALFPYNMDDIAAQTQESVYGMLTKSDASGGTAFIHPVAARYVLYKLLKELKKWVSRDLTGERANALQGGRSEQYDNARTVESEMTPQERLVSRKWYQRGSDFMQEFRRTYGEYIDNKVEACKEYEKALLRREVYTRLAKRVELLLEQFEIFFRNLRDVDSRLDDSLEQNARATDRMAGTQRFVYASRANKDAAYEALNIDASKNNADVNKAVITALYGRVCAEQRPAFDANKMFCDLRINDIFAKEVCEMFAREIDGDAEMRGVVDIDIITALGKERRANLGNEGAANAVVEEQAFQDCIDRLKNTAAPFLRYEVAPAQGPNGVRAQTAMTFWGYAPALSAHGFNIAGALGINETQASKAYSKYELLCYSAAYGIRAQEIPKFQEIDRAGRSGLYYSKYRSVVDRMEREAQEDAGAYVATPHLDKTWHKTLPYISQEMQDCAEQQFFHGLLLAVAYGALAVQRGDNVGLRITVRGAGGAAIYQQSEIVYNGHGLRYTQVADLIAALRDNSDFLQKVLPDVEERYRRELETLSTYEATAVLRGLAAKGNLLNPVDMTIRSGSMENRLGLIGAMEKIAGEMAERYDAGRTNESRESAAMRLCKRIYDAHTLENTEAFQVWKEKFGIIEEGDGSGEGSDDAQV